MKAMFWIAVEVASKVLTMSRLGAASLKVTWLPSAETDSMPPWVERRRHRGHPFRNLREAAAETEVAVEVEHHVLRGELAAVHRRLVVPVHAGADVEHDRVRIGLFPALRQPADHDVIRQVVGAEVEVVAVHTQVGHAQLLHHERRDHRRRVAVEGVRVGRIAAQGVGERPAVLGGGNHLPGGGIEHHLLLHAHGLFGLRGGPRHARGQREHRQHREQPVRGKCDCFHITLLPAGSY